MSLMQLVQSSFTNVPNGQQVLQQHRLVQLAGSQPAEGNASLKTQVPTQEEKGKTGQESSVFQPRKSVEDESNNGQIKVGISKHG